MWRVFQSAFVRKVGYLVAALLFGLLIGHRSRAQGTLVYNWAFAGTSCVGQASSAAGAGTARASCGSAAGVAGAGNTYTFDSVLSDPAVAGGTYSVRDCFKNGGTGPCQYDTVSGSITAAVACPVPSGQASYMAMSAFVPAGSSACGSDGCMYQALPSNAERKGLVTGDSTVLQVMSSQGNACTSTAASPTSAATVTNGKDSSACTAGNGTTLCIQTSPAGLASEAVNGSTVLPSFMTPGSCMSMSNGQVACQAPTGTSTVTSPPGPDSAVSGALDTPIAVVTESGKVIQIFSAAQVAGSHHASVTGSGTGTGGGAAGPTTTCVPSAPGVMPVVVCTSTAGSGAEGGGLDCTAPPACTGDAIQCGVVQQVWLGRCAVTDVQALRNSVAAGTGEGVSTVTSDQSAVLKTTGVLPTGGGVCPEPSHFGFFGHEIQLDLFSFLCLFAGRVSGVVMVVAYLSGAAIWLRALLA